MREALAALALAATLLAAADARAASLDEDDDPGLAPGPVAERAPGFSHGSRPGDTLEGAAIVWFASLDRASGAPRWTRDLGARGRQDVLGGRSTVSLGDLGWLGGEVLGLSLAAQRGVLEEPFRLDGHVFERGDLVRSDTRTILGSLRYGHELRLRLLPAGLALDVFLSPTLGAGLWDLDRRLRRVAPLPTPALARHSQAWLLTPGARAGMEVMDTLRLGADVEWLPGVPEALRSLEPKILGWERLRLHVALALGPVEVSVGWRRARVSLREGRTRQALLLQGVDLSAGLAF